MTVIGFLSIAPVREGSAAGKVTDVEAVLGREAGRDFGDRTE